MTSKYLDDDSGEILASLLINSLDIVELRLSNE
jgi:hypothetical protein